MKLTGISEKAYSDRFLTDASREGNFLQLIFTLNGGRTLRREVFFVSLFIYRLSVWHFHLEATTLEINSTVQRNEIEESHKAKSKIDHVSPIIIIRFFHGN